MARDLLLETLECRRLLSLTTIEIDPPVWNMVQGGAKQFVATGYDQDRNEIDIPDPQWMTTGGQITPIAETCIYQATEVGTFELTCYADSGNSPTGGPGTAAPAPLAIVSGSAVIRASDVQLVSIELSPPTTMLKVGNNKEFTATARDQQGNTVALTNPKWTTTGGGTLGASGSTCAYTATTAGSYTITCEEDETGITGTAAITVTDPPQLVSIELSPPTTMLKVGNNKEFTATASDQQGNTVALTNPKWTTTGGGTLGASGSTCAYTATTAGNYTITCEEDETGITGTAAITVTDPPQLVSIELSPPTTMLKVGNNKEFTATARDQQGNTVALTNPKWTTTGGGTLGASGSTCAYTATTAGSYTITCEEDETGITGTAAITVTDPPQLVSIELSPPTTMLKVGNNKEFTATARDQQGNTVALTNPKWTTTGGGTLGASGSTCAYTATTAGSYTITCEEDETGITGTAAITVTDPPQLVSIELSPPTTMLKVGNNKEFTATARDQQGNTVALTNPKWTTTGGGTLGASGSTCAYTATTAGNYTITCEEDGTGIKGTAAITVSAAPPQDRLDFGDAPDATYPTLLASNGARHTATGVWLGDQRDAESDGLPTADAQGDDRDGSDDEDGVTFGPVLRQGQRATVEVRASGPGRLDAFIDFNANGDFGDAGEKIFDTRPVAAGTNNLTFTIPAGAASGDTYARFRLSSAGGLGPDGPAADGEVEDYRISIGVEMTVTPLGDGLYQYDAYHVTPGGLVAFVYGTRRGGAQLPGYGVTLGVADPVFIGLGMADPQGHATFVSQLPFDPQVQTVFFQTVELAPNPQVGPLQTVETDKMGIHRGNAFYLDVDNSGAWTPGVDRAFQWGLAGDTPLVGDWDGDGKDELGIYRGNAFYLDIDGSGAWTPGVDRAFQWGLAGDTPLVGDFNGDGRDELGIHRGNAFYLDVDNSGAWTPGVDRAFQWGLAGDTPLVGDFNGDGKDELGIHRGNAFYLDVDNSGAWTPGVDRAFQWGLPGDTPLVGDFNGDGADELGIHRGNSFYLDVDNSGAWTPGVDRAFQWGLAGDTPLVGDWAAAMPLMAADGPARLESQTDTLTEADVVPILTQAIDAYSALPLSAQQYALLDQVTVRVDDLAGARLGEAVGTTITLDANAAGYGWFVDPTPWDNTEFDIPHSASRIPNSFDLLTAVMHELGHVLGYDHQDDDDSVMAETLATGTRPLLDTDAIDDVFASLD